MLVSSPYCRGSSFYGQQLVLVWIKYLVMTDTIATKISSQCFCMTMTTHTMPGLWRDINVFLKNSPASKVQTCINQAPITPVMTILQWGTAWKNMHENILALSQNSSCIRILSLQKVCCVFKALRMDAFNNVIGKKSNLCLFSPGKGSKYLC